MSVRIYKDELHVIFADIQQEITTKLNFAISPGGKLPMINSVFVGERVDLGELNTPSIFAIQKDHRPIPSGGNKTQHDINWHFEVLVHSYNPKEADEKAKEIQAKLYDLLMEDRCLNNKVLDTIPLNYQTTLLRDTEQTQIYWNALEFAYRIIRLES